MRFIFEPALVLFIQFRKIKMNSQGYAKYDETKNQLEIIRPGENSLRTIRCNNLDPSSLKIHGVQHGVNKGILD